MVLSERTIYAIVIILGILAVLCIIFLFIRYSKDLAIGVETSVGKFNINSKSGKQDDKNVTVGDLIKKSELEEKSTNKTSFEADFSELSNRIKVEIVEQFKIGIMKDALLFDFDVPLNDKVEQTFELVLGGIRKIVKRDYVGSIIDPDNPFDTFHTYDLNETLKLKQYLKNSIYKLFELSHIRFEANRKNLNEFRSSIENEVRDYELRTSKKIDLYNSDENPSDISLIYSEELIELISNVILKRDDLGLKWLNDDAIIDEKIDRYSSTVVLIINNIYQNIKEKIKISKGE